MHSEHENYQRFSGTVTKKVIGTYFVQTGDRMVPCAISPRLRKHLIYPTADPHSLSHIVREVRKIEVIDPVAVGDQVSWVDAQDGSGLIVEVQPRRSKLSRRSAVPMPGAHAFEQVVVANLDQVVAVLSAAQPAIKWNLLDRYLASAESMELGALICITKLDLVNRQDLEVELDAYRRIGYPLVLTSSVTGEGLSELKEALQGRLSVLVGKSGVGKTTLLNAMQPGLGLRVNEVNPVTGKGKHTTTNLEMVPLESGGSLVDTPGMREYGLWDVPAAELAMYFPEMRPFVGSCRFGLDCGHETEPGCAIRKAVQVGEIDGRRYQSYLHLKGAP